MDSDDIAMLDAQVVADNPVDAGTSIIKIIVGQHDQNGILALLAADKNGIAAEQLELLHGVVGQGDDGVVIVGSVRHPGQSERLAKPRMWANRR